MGSTRVGAAQALAELDIDLAAITEAGGRKSTRMRLYYAEKINECGEIGNVERGDSLWARRIRIWRWIGRIWKNLEARTTLPRLLALRQDSGTRALFFLASIDTRNPAFP